MEGRLVLTDHAIERYRERFGPEWNPHMALLRSHVATPRERRLMRRYEQRVGLSLSKADTDCCITAVDPETQVVMILRQRYVGFYALVTCFRMPTHRDIDNAKPRKEIHGCVYFNGEIGKRRRA